MYNQLAQPAINSEPNITLVQSMKQEFQDLNDKQTKLILAIEDKMHDILNKRVPSPDSEKPENTISDFSTAMGVEFRKMRINTNRLDDIFSHLQSII